MKYFANIDDREFSIDIEHEGSQPTITWNGQEVQCQVHRNGSEMTLIVDGKKHSVIVDKVNDKYILNLDGEFLELELWNQREHLIRKVTNSQSKAKSGKNEIKAPMPGLVIKTLVNEGDVVTKGDGIVVIEAMKMENQIKATLNGTVKQIMVSSGQVVNKGDLLVWIDANV